MDKAGREVMSELVLRCAQCGVTVSNPVQRLLDLSRLSSAENTAYVPTGYFIVGEGVGTEWPRFGHFVLNPGDLLNVQPHSDASRSAGCCGPMGIHGPNLVCSGGHEVAALQADCWGPASVSLPPELVRATDQ